MRTLSHSFKLKVLSAGGYVHLIAVKLGTNCPRCQTSCLPVHRCWRFLCQEAESAVLLQHLNGSSGPPHPKPPPPPSPQNYRGSASDTTRPSLSKGRNFSPQLTSALTEEPAPQKSLKRLSHLCDAVLDSIEQVFVHLSRQCVIQQDIGALLVRAKGPNCP